MADDLVRFEAWTVRSPESAPVRFIDPPTAPGLHITVERVEDSENGETRRRDIGMDVAAWVEAGALTEEQVKVLGEILASLRRYASGGYKAADEALKDAGEALATKTAALVAAAQAAADAATAKAEEAVKAAADAQAVLVEVAKK